MVFMGVRTSWDMFAKNKDFVLLASPWAMIETPKGQTIFDEVGIEKIVTDVFYIRYIDGLTKEDWIVYDGNRYDIQTVEDMDKNKLFQKLPSVVRGVDTLEATKA